jgi:hypothetical protein
MSYFEMMMLVCFGISWPLSIQRSIQTKVVRGKSVGFMSVVAVGYVFGILHKYYHMRDWVMILYIFNLLLVLTDIYLYFYYSRRYPLKQLVKNVR